MYSVWLTINLLLKFATKRPDYSGAKATIYGGIMDNIIGNSLKYLSKFNNYRCGK